MRRGAGALWGADFTAEWLKANKLTHIIRSHECVEQGFERLHGNLVMTLFSASNYYEGETNMGAFLRLNAMDDTNNMELFQYVTQDGARGGAAGSWKAAVGEMETAAIERASIILYEYKSKLLPEFQRIDAKKTGFVTPPEWAAIMNAIIPIRLPWLNLKAHFVEVSGGKINYNFFLEVG